MIRAVHLAVEGLYQHEIVSGLGINVIQRQQFLLIDLLLEKKAEKVANVDDVKISLSCSHAPS